MGVDDVVVGQSPELAEPSVGPDDPSFLIEHQDAVGGGVERGREQRKRVAQVVLGVDLLGDLGSRDHVATDHRVVDQVDDGELEWHRPSVAVSDESQPHGHRPGRGGALGGPSQGAVEPLPVLLVDQVCQRLSDDGFGIVSEHAGDHAGHRGHKAVG